MTLRNPFPAVMIDLETLSSDTDAPVIQIGATAFSFATGEYGETITILVCPDLRKYPASLSTVAWWMQQDQAARDSVARCAAEGRSPYEALRDLRSFIENNCVADVEVWAMPPEFDLTILANMARLEGAKLPWKYNKTRDLRTLESLVGCRSADRIKATVAHDAGADALAQAQTAIMYHGRLQQ